MELNNIYQNHPLQAQLNSLLSSQPKNIVKLTGLYGSARALLAANVISQSNTIHLLVFEDKEEAAYFTNDLSTVFDESRLFLFSSSYKRPGQSNLTDPGAIIQRTELLNALNSPNSNNVIIITYPDAIAEKVVSKTKFAQNTLLLNEGEKITIDFLKETLKEYQFERVDFVYEPGQYAIRGSIVDVFSFSDEYPYRIDFFGNEVESIRTFNIETQLSVQKHKYFTIVPDVQKFGVNESKISILEYLPPNAILWFGNLTFCIDRLQTLNAAPWHHAEDRYNEGEAQLLPELTDVAELLALIKKQTIVELGTHNYFKPDTEFHFNTQAQPVFNKKFELLAQHLHNNVEKGVQNYIVSENPKQFDRLKEIFASIDRQVVFEPLQTTIHEGFTDVDLQICLFTDHQIFERYHKYKIKQGFTRSSALTISELSDLHPGDYVVHIDHGVGKFGGIEKVDINGRMQDVIKLVYRDNDVLYISLHALHRISKYRSKDGEEPKIHKLGSGVWQKLKATTKSKVKDIAKDLIALYAHRKAANGFAFNPDTYLQQELEASFIYEDTPDQEKATQLTKKAMEASYPMDMLVCGDVGFGKTEIAIRAAFKAATDGKQVAVLVPTTILALQHYKTFRDRLKEFPVKVDYISRMRKATDQKEILKEVAEGKVDILIGTHKLLGADIKFKDMGLLIIDEEQKFGVAMKEKLKRLKLNVDTLTLTATPIPRTLQFSLMGARDLAIINTPPPNRHPIVTELHGLNEDIIREGINYELQRGGQVFFINNRIQNIYEIEKLINKAVPDAKTIVGHGQMDGEKLENIMMNFINGDYDVLIATTIIESGIDIANANTIFINDAHHFGLSDLHQLRGRVGRSNKKAFCYLLAPPVTVLTPEARRRLKAIEQFSDLGSGFNIAMQDLDIRGAGNLLGGEQSGFIAEIGFETYQRILNEAILELKENELKYLFTENKNEETGEDTSLQASMVNQRSAAFGSYVTDCQIDTDFEVMIPEHYVENQTERIKLYRELDNLNNNDELLAFEKRIIDRFGPIPTSTLELMNVVRLRWLAISMGIERLILKNNRIIIHFVSNPQSPYYQSAIFGKILNFIQKHPKVFAMKEDKNKLSMSANNIGKIADAIAAIDKINA